MEEYNKEEYVILLLDENDVEVEAKILTAFYYEKAKILVLALEVKNEEEHTYTFMEYTENKELKAFENESLYLEICEYFEDFYFGEGTDNEKKEE